MLAPQQKTCTWTATSNAPYSEKTIEKKACFECGQQFKDTVTKCKLESGKAKCEELNCPTWGILVECGAPQINEQIGQCYSTSTFLAQPNMNSVWKITAVDLAKRCGGIHKDCA